MSKRVFGLGIALLLLSACASALAAAAPSTSELLAKIGLTRGICALVGDPGCQEAIALARQSDLTLYVHVEGAANLESACRAADAAGFYGTRIFVEQGSADRIGLADNVADAVIVLGQSRPALEAEALRVVRPEGKVIRGGQVRVKPLPAGIDDWPHHYHGPDNNPQSKDQVARAPFWTQFVAEPSYAPAPQAVVAARGRLFMAFGHVAWHEREEPFMNQLFCVNGYNGTLLWTRPLTPGIMVDRNTIVATPDALYLADDQSCKVLDAASGRLVDEIRPPADKVGGAFWKWLALEDGTLYGLIGAAEDLDPDARWRRPLGH